MEENKITEPAVIPEESSENQQPEFVYEDVSNIVNSGKKIGSLRIRSLTAAVIMALMGAACLIFLRSVGGYILGGVLLLLVFASVFLIKDARAADVYDDAVVLYSYEDQQQAVRLPLERIQEWNNNANGDNRLFFRMDNGQMFSVLCCQVLKADEYLTRVMADKSTAQLYREKLQNKTGGLTDNLKTGISRLLNKKQK